MSATDYSALSRQQQRAVVADVAEGDGDKSHRDLLVDETKSEVEHGSFYPLGEPVSSVRCDSCCQTINLNNSCAAIKRFLVGEGPDGPIEQAPEIICNSCASNTDTLASPDEVGVIVKGILERRRTRPGDDSDAPYLLYVSRTDSANVKIIRPDSDADRGPSWSAF